MSRARDNANLGAQAGSGLTASDLTTGTLGNTVQDNITRVGTVGTGTWEGTTVAVNQGGTGVTTKTGTGNVVLSSSPTLVTPALGTPASGNASNLTSIPADDLTGTITSGTQDAITRLGTVTAGNLTASANFVDGASSVTSSYTLDFAGDRGIVRNTITGVVQMYFLISGFPITGTIYMCNLPVGFRPAVDLLGPMTCTNWISAYHCKIEEDGDCILWVSDFVGTARSTTAQGILLTATYPVQT